MKVASATSSTRSKSTAVRKPRSRAAKAIATVTGPLAAAAASITAAGIVDEADTVVAVSLLPIGAADSDAEVVHHTEVAPQPAAATPINEVCDVAYVEQLLAATAALETTLPSVEDNVAAAPAVATSIASAELAVAIDIVAEPRIEASSPELNSEMTTIMDTEAEASVVANNAGDAVVVLPAHCLIRDAAELRRGLLTRMSDAAAVIIDAQHVERIDTAAMQVLFAFVRDRRAQQHAVEWSGLNEVFIDAAQVLGLDSLLGLPVKAVA